jgi:hypothetical protein
MSKEKRSEVKRKLESTDTDENEDSPEVNISIMPNFQTEISEAAKDEHPPLDLEQFEEEPVGDFSEKMI